MESTRRSGRLMPRVGRGNVGDAVFVLTGGIPQYRRRLHAGDREQRREFLDYGLLLQSKKVCGELIARIARQGIAGVVLELLKVPQLARGVARGSRD
jgi:hypothetical protein